MIVSVNQKTIDKYKNLFAKAYQILDEKNLIKDSAKHDDGTFHSIDEYFAHLEYLYEIDKTFIMLPLDESEEVSFAIDADKRTIKNPKITIMQNDQNAEVVMFTIDRYFDYKDLDTAYIYVQWTLPDGTEGATAVEMKDLSIPGKIRFGWPLDNEITAQKGMVKFSVRFWNVDKIKDKDGNYKDTVVYSFNTQTSSLTITESLQPELNENYSVNTPAADGFFKKAIINSQIYKENGSIPLVPTFEDPGLNLNTYESLVTIDGKDTLTMIAQAINYDMGELSYEWWYKPAQDSKDGKFKANSAYPYNSIIDKDGEIVPGFSEYGGTVEDLYKEVELKDDQLVRGENYYIFNGTKYVAYDGSLPRPTLYEKFTSYTVPEGDIEVTGEYFVKAINTIGDNTSKEISSKICTLVSPNPIEFTKDGNLKTSAFLPSSDDEKTKLEVKVTDDDNISAKRIYTWYHSKTQEEENSWTGENSLEVTEPGWYKVEVKATLNRETTSVMSNECKVTFEPAAPEIEDLEKEQILIMSYGDISSSKIASGATIPVYISSQPGDAELDIKIKLNSPDGYDKDLYCEEIVCRWYYQIPDTNYVKIDEKQIQLENVGEFYLSSLTVPFGDEKNDADNVTYRCDIVNKLNGKEAIGSLYFRVN